MLKQLAIGCAAIPITIVILGAIYMAYSWAGI